MRTATGLGYRVIRLIDCMHDTIEISANEKR